MKENFLTIVGEFSELTVIEKSKFICYLKHVESEDEAKEYIAEIKKKHFDATHNCSAFIADSDGNMARFSDDGEPQGTAGMPMLEALKNRGIFQIVAVVTRYFGGIKLGAGGLVRAYSGAVSSALNSADVREKCLCKTVKISADYDKYRLILKLFESGTYGEIIEQNFDDGVWVKAYVRNEQYDKFMKDITETFLGKQRVEVLSDGYCMLKG
jgi:uncharacterized YigZ family protein